MKQKINIYIGDIYASKEPAVIYTFLGSCVGVCLYDPVARIGGMNHILLPGRADLKHFDSAARYGINAMELLINRIMALGGDRRRLLAKVFGGAQILPFISKKNGTGRKNAEFVLEFLEVEKIRIISHDLGGQDVRRIFFHTDTSDVLLKRIAPRYRQDVVVRERERLEHIREEAKRPGRITLF